MKPGFGHSQIAAHGDFGDLERAGNFFHGKSAEIAKLNGFAFPGVESFQGFEAGIECEQLRALRFSKADRLLEGHIEPRAFAGIAAAGLVHQDLAHEARSHAEKVRAVLPGWIGLIDQAEVGLVDESCGLQSIGVPFPAEITGSELAELAVDQGGQVIESLLVAFRPSGEELGNVVSGAHTWTGSDLSITQKYIPNRRLQTVTG